MFLNVVLRYNVGKSDLYVQKFPQDRDYSANCDFALEGSTGVWHKVMLTGKLCFFTRQYALHRPILRLNPRLPPTLYRSMSNNQATVGSPYRTPWTPGQYPVTRRTDHVDIYKSAARGEVKIADPYNWLEENTDETDKWTTTQHDFTRKYIDQNPHRDALEENIRANSDYAKVVLLLNFHYRSCATR